MHTDAFCSFQATVQESGGVAARIGLKRTCGSDHSSIAATSSAWNPGDNLHVSAECLHGGGGALLDLILEVTANVTKVFCPPHVRANRVCARHLSCGAEENVSCAHRCNLLVSSYCPRHRRCGGKNCAETHLRE